MNSTILRRWSTTEILFYFSVISPPCIAMPKAYILPLWFFSFFFFRRLISEVTERISTELGHIFTYDWYFKNWSEVWLRALPQRGGGRNRFFWDRLRTSTENISATEIKSSIYRMILYAPQIWWILVHKGWERLASFCPPTPNVCAQNELQAHICDTFWFISYSPDGAYGQRSYSKSLVSVGEAAHRPGGLTLGFSMQLVSL